MPERAIYFQTRIINISVLILFLILGKSIAQVALRWTLQKDVVASTIIGATSIKQLEDNMAAGSGWNMSVEEVKDLLYRLSTNKNKQRLLKPDNTA